MSVVVFNFPLENLYDDCYDNEKEQRVLIGIRLNEKTVVLGSAQIGINIKEEYQLIFSMLPYGYSIVGCVEPNTDLLSLMQLHSRFPFIIVKQELFTNTIQISMSDESKPIQQPPTCISNLFSSMQWIRVSYPLDITYSSSEDLLSACQSMITDIPIRLCGDQIVDSKKSVSVSNLSSFPSLNEIHVNIPFWMNSVITLKGVSLLNSSTIPAQVTNLDQHYVNLLFDCLLCIPKEDPISVIPEMVRIMMLRQLPYLLSQNTFLYHFAIADYLPLTVSHSFPQFSFYDSYDQLNEYRQKWKEDEKECEWRAFMTTRFGLKRNFPFFRNTCSLFYSIPHERYIKMTGEEGIIADIHKALPYLENAVYVEGHYLYYHYNQQQFTDKGWGCAYRSLQTLCSYFVMNHFYDMRIPTVIDIQSLLVQIGDKPSSFLGSKEWIGSQEVGYVLSTLFDVDCKYILLDKGKDIVNHITRLVDHFKNQQTPVMIGGGVLAFTCLGVQWNPVSKEIKLLILDPHYAGCDDYKEITKNKQQMEGYRAMCCGWRTVKEIFNDKYFYRLCLPQRPHVYSYIC